MNVGLETKGAPSACGSKTSFFSCFFRPPLTKGRPDLSTNFFVKRRFPKNLFDKKEVLTSLTKGSGCA